MSMTYEQLNTIHFFFSHVLMVAMCLAVLILDPIHEPRQEKQITPPGFIPLQSYGRDSILNHLPKRAE